MAIPKSVERFIDGGDACALFDEKLRFADDTGRNMRLPTKPRQLPTSTPILPSVFESCMQVAITSLEVALPRTISSRRMTLAGLKKCVPMTDPGREVAAAISSIFSVEVLLARIAPRLADAIEFVEDLFLERHAFEDGFDDHVRFAKSS